MVIGDHLLNKTVQFALRPHLEATGSGGDRETMALNQTNDTYKIRLSSPTGREQLIGGRENAVITHIGYCIPSIDVERNDRLIVGSFGYDVLMVLPPSIAHHLKLLLEKLPATFKYMVTKEGLTIIMKNEDGTEEVLEFKD